MEKRPSFPFFIFMCYTVMSVVWTQPYWTGSCQPNRRLTVYVFLVTDSSSFISHQSLLEFGWNLFACFVLFLSYQYHRGSVLVIKSTSRVKPDATISCKQSVFQNTKSFLVKSLFLGCAWRHHFLKSETKKPWEGVNLYQWTIFQLKNMLRLIAGTF